jgi:HlyD family secretion protein
MKARVCERCTLCVQALCFDRDAAQPMRHESGRAMIHFKLLASAALLCGLAGCQREPRDALQGYVEGEFVYVASPYAGALESLSVQRGSQVKRGDPLFTLDDTVETAGLDEARRRFDQARATLDDARKGRRETEIAALEAQLQQARSALDLADADYGRQKQLLESGAATRQEFDRAKSRFEQDEQRVQQIEADLKTARLGSRDDQVIAADANMRALAAAVERAEWDHAQKRQNAPQDALVFDTLYREGEWVAAGRPAVVLLPPQNIKVRAFVPEPRIGTIHPGDEARVTVDGIGAPFVGKVSYVSPKAEFTPPVIYSRETRSKLVFMIEIDFDPATAAKLNPGQPVDVMLGK